MKLTRVITPGARNSARSARLHKRWAYSEQGRQLLCPACACVSAMRFLVGQEESTCPVQQRRVFSTSGRMGAAGFLLPDRRSYRFNDHTKV